jgi:hypothetical protein
VTYAELVEEVRALDPSVELTNMFGMQTMKVRGKAFAGLWHDDATFKLPPDELKLVLAWPDFIKLDPVGGRPMKQWAQVPQSHSDEWLRLAEVAKGYVISLQTER